MVAKIFVCCCFLVAALQFSSAADTNLDVLTAKSLLPSLQQKKADNLVESSRSYGGYGSGSSRRYVISTVGNADNQPSSYNDDAPPVLYGNQPSSSPSPYTAPSSTASPYRTTKAATSYYAATTPAAPVLLGSQCNVSSDCASMPNSRCFNGFCDCSIVSVALGYIACLPMANAFGDKCIITAQCRGLDPLAACYLDRCMCESVYYVAGKSCAAPGGGDYYLPNSNIGGGGIQCLRKQPLGGACCDDRQCSYEVWNSQCTNNQCQCAAGFVNIGNHACAPKATMLGGPCSVNAQCMSLPGTSCDINGNCTCNAQAQFVTGMIVPVVGGATDRRKRQATPATGAMMQMAGSMGLLSVMCMPTMRLGAMCMSNEQCSTRTPNSICAMGVCTCSNGFLSDSTNSTCQKKAVRFAKSVYNFRVSCCGNTTATQSRFIGQVCPDTAFTNLPPPYTFTASDTRFTIDTNGGISINTILTATTTVTVTISASSRTNTAAVILTPDPCCSQAAIFTTSSVAVTLLRIPPTGCTAQGPTSPGNTNPFVLNVLNFLSMPCGELLATAITSSTITTMAGGVASGNVCILRPSGDLDFYTTAAVAPPAIASGTPATCVVTVTTAACNGIVATSTLNAILMCP